MNSLQRIGLRIVASLLASAGVWAFLSVAAPSKDPSLTSPESTKSPFDVEQVTAFEVRSDADTLQLEKRNNSASEALAWRILSQQEDFLADEAQVKTWLERLSTMSLRPVLNPGPPQLYGLLRPRLLFSVYQSNNLIAQISVGERILMEDAFYVSRAPLPGVFSVSANEILPLLQDRDVLRERRVVPIQEDKISSVTLETPEETFTLRREGDHFALRTPNGIDAADLLNSQAWVATLTQMQIVAFSLAGPVSTPSKTITIESDAMQVKLAIFSEESNWAKRTLIDKQGKREEDWVQLASFNSLTPLLASLQENRLISSLQTDSIARIKLHEEPNNLVFIGQSTEGWQFLAPRKGPLSLTRVESFFAALLSLHGETLTIDAKTQELQPKHFEPHYNKGETFYLLIPDVKIELFNEAGDAVLTLIISAPLEDGSAYAKLETQSKIVKLSKEEMARLDLSGWLSGKD
jgi:hypothetical protein